MLKKTMFALALGACLAGFAKEKAEVPQQLGDLAKKPADAWKAVEKQMEEDQGNLEDAIEDCTVATAHTDIGASPKSRDYVLNRVLAFETTDFKVKQAVAKELKAKISSAMSASNVESHGGLSANSLNGNKDLANLVNAEIAKELKAQGIDPNNAEAVKKALPRLKGLESFKKRMDIASQAYVMGVVTYASYATKDRVALLAYSNPAQRAIAEGLVTGQMKKFAPGTKVTAVIRQIVKNKRQLADTFGIRTMINEKGEPTIIAFAHAPVLASDDTAEEEAADTAMTMIREFAGTAVAIKKASERGRTVAVVQNDEETDAKAISSAMAEMKKEAKAEAASMEFSGIRASRKGVYRLPSGDKIAWAIAYWTPTSARNASAAYAQGQRQQEMIEGGAAVEEKEVKKVAPRGGNKRKDAGSTGRGVVFGAF